jgi:hypothetical protein
LNKGIEPSDNNFLKTVEKLTGLKLSSKIVPAVVLTFLIE